MYTENYTYILVCVRACVCVFKLGREPSDHPRHSNRYCVRCGTPGTCYVSSFQAGALNLSVAETHVVTQRDLRQSVSC